MKGATDLNSITLIIRQIAPFLVVAAIVYYLIDMLIVKKSHSEKSQLDRISELEKTVKLLCLGIFVISISVFLESTKHLADTHSFTVALKNAMIEFFQI